MLAPAERVIALYLLKETGALFLFIYLKIKIMDKKLLVGTPLSRVQLKNVKGGVESDPPACLEDYTYDCANNDACCSKNCERNGTNTGTLCMP
jgi:hypothetical protein